ncbi:MAG TPA: serine hydrolase domain-containing protein [Acidimicrobiales bacterium]|nr:serine hydrolase domain-containing protein [Acidimicrobiales bacterium]
MAAARDAAGALVERVRARPWGLAVVAIANGETVCQVDQGDDALTPQTRFQIGSITKTMTGVLLAESVVRGELTLDTTLGEVFDDAGRCGAVTVGQLATQRSGLPRLPPNLDPATIDRADPYAAFTFADLVEALGMVEEPAPGTYAYSNFGFMVLGAALGRVTDRPYSVLIAKRLFAPLEMHGSFCRTPALDEPGIAPGYDGASTTPWWSTNLPGPGGVGASIEDLGAYLRAHLDPDATPLAAAISLATEMHAEAPSPMGLGWGHQGGGLWHNGGTGGFRSFVAFHRPTGTAVGLLANSAAAEVVDAAGFAVLTDLVRAASPKDR